MKNYKGERGGQVLQDKFWHIKYNIDKLANLQGPEEKKRREKRKEKKLMETETFNTLHNFADGLSRKL